MGTSIYLLPHQERSLQSPENFPHIRWHFLLGGYGCIDGDSELLTVEGSVKIKDFNGGYIYSLDSNGHLVKAKAGTPVKYAPEPMYRVELENGHSIICTKAHKLLTGQGWMTVEQLVAGQHYVYTLMPISSNGNPQETSQDICLISHSLGTSLVKSITYSGETVYYDLNVPGYHNYIANGIIHHNCGKTTCLVFSLLYWVGKLQGVKDDGGKYARIIVGGYTYAHLEQTVMIDLLSYLDNSKTVYRNDTKNHIMYIGTVEIIFAQLSEPDRIFGQSVYCVFCDEIDELPEDVMIEAMKSVSQRCRQKLKGQRSNFLQSFSTAQGYKGFYRLYTHYKKNNISFVLIRALTKDNIYLPKEYIEDLEKSFTETERKVFMEGEFLSVAQGRVIPGFDWDKNFTDDDLDTKLYPREKVFIGMDFNTGYSRASAWIARNGRMDCIKYYDFPDAMEAPNVFRYDFPEQDIFWIPDVTSKDSFPQFARALRQNNIHIIYRTKSPLVEDSCFFISSLCYQGRIMIHSAAASVAEAFAQASRDKNNKIPKGVGESSPIHTIDGARYATSYMGLVLPDFKDIRRSLMSHIATYRNILESDENNEDDVKRLGSGYTQIEGQAYLR